MSDAGLGDILTGLASGLQQGRLNRLQDQQQREYEQDRQAQAMRQAMADAQQQSTFAYNQSLRLTPEQIAQQRALSLQTGQAQLAGAVISPDEAAQLNQYHGGNFFTAGMPREQATSLAGILDANKGNTDLSGAQAALTARMAPVPQWHAPLRPGVTDPAVTSPAPDITDTDFFPLERQFPGAATSLELQRKALDAQPEMMDVPDGQGGTTNVPTKYAAQIINALKPKAPPLPKPITNKQLEDSFPVAPAQWLGTNYTGKPGQMSDAARKALLADIPTAETRLKFPTPEAAHLWGEETAGLLNKLDGSFGQMSPKTAEGIAAKKASTAIAQKRLNTYIAGTKAREVLEGEKYATAVANHRDTLSLEHARLQHTIEQGAQSADRAQLMRELNSRTHEYTAAKAGDLRDLQDARSELASLANTIHQEKQANADYVPSADEVSRQKDLIARIGTAKANLDGFDKDYKTDVQEIEQKVKGMGKKNGAGKTITAASDQEWVTRMKGKPGYNRQTMLNTVRGMGWDDAKIREMGI